MRMCATARRRVAHASVHPRHGLGGRAGIATKTIRLKSSNVSVQSCQTTTMGQTRCTTNNAVVTARCQEQKRQMGGANGENQRAATQMSTINRRNTATNKWRKWRKNKVRPHNSNVLADWELSTAGSRTANCGNLARSALDIASPALRRYRPTLWEQRRGRYTGRSLEFNLKFNLFQL